jgi:hypothetical protein
LCEVFHVLPYAGGLFDQPYSVLFRMETIKRADDAVEEAESKKAAGKEEADQKLAERLGATS